MRYETDKVISDATVLRLRVRKVEFTSGTTLLVLVALLLIGTIPGWPYTQHWGYGPSAVLAMVLLGLIALWLKGRI